MQKGTVLEVTEGRASKIARGATYPFEGKVFSKDGTAIAFDRIGNGPPVILVDGALCYRGMGQSGQLAELLAQHFTVFTYDRRGRGASGDTAPYAMGREVEDIAALLGEAGGAAFVWGTSSGAVLALEAANRLSGIKKLALYEAPFIVDDTRPTTENGWDRISSAVAQACGSPKTPADNEINDIALLPSHHRSAINPDYVSFRSCNPRLRFFSPYVRLGC